MQDVELARDHFPAPHATGATLFEAQLDPAGQFRQSERTVPPGVVRYVPPGHAEQVLAPAAAYVPATHCAHVALESAFVALEAVPALHDVHDPEPAAAHFPGPHATHVAELVALVAALDVPAAH